jgi:putative tricarboxylic transport membrane protein
VFVGSLLIVLAIALAVAVSRGSLGEAEAGEDIDLGSRVDMKTVLLLLGVFVANILLIDLLGWVISGGLLFYGSAIALGSRHFIRDLVISAALSLGTFYGFAIGLGVGLPAGILQGIL